MTNTTARADATLVQNAEGKFERTIEASRLEADAARLRSLGMSYREIAATQKIDVATAYRRVQHALAAVPVESVSELRRVELDRLDELQKRLFKVASSDHPMVSHGRVIPNVIDLTPNLQAMAQLLRLSESRRKLLGLDAPTRVHVRVSDEVTAEIERLAEQLGVDTGAQAT